MFSIINSTVIYILPLFILFTRCTIVVAEDDITDEIFTDLLIGVGMSICESFIICKIILTVVGFICFIITLIGLCTGGIDCNDICNIRTVRRVFVSSTIT